MAFDTGVFSRYQSNIESPQNALMRGLEVQRAQQANALQSMQMRDLHEQRQLQIQAAREAAAQKARAQNALMGMPSPQEEAMMQATERVPGQQVGPTPAALARMPTADPRAQAMHPLAKAGLTPFGDYFKARYPAPDLKAVKMDENIVDMSRGGAVVTPGAQKPQPLPPGMQMGPNGPQWIPGYLEGKGQVAAQGATRLNVNTAEKGLLQSLSGKVGDDVMNASEAARGAQKSLSTVSSMRQALASAKAITGAAANQRTFLAQLGFTLGLGPADTPETLAKTREMMMGFGQLELDAAAQMKGQGQITESERAILRRAAAGDITLTAPEITTVLNVSERRAKAQISRNQRNVATLKRMPNAAPLVDFLSANGESTDSPEFTLPTAESIAAEAARRGMRK